MLQFAVDNLASAANVDFFLSAFLVIFIYHRRGTGENNDAWVRRTRPIMDTALLEKL